MNNIYTHCWQSSDEKYQIKINSDGTNFTMSCYANMWQSLQGDERAYVFMRDYLLHRDAFNHLLNDFIHSAVNESTLAKCDLRLKYLNEAKKLSKILRPEIVDMDLMKTLFFETTVYQVAIGLLSHNCVECGYYSGTPHTPSSLELKLILKDYLDIANNNLELKKSW